MIPKEIKKINQEADPQAGVSTPARKAKPEGQSGAKLLSNIVLTLTIKFRMPLKYPMPPRMPASPKWATAIHFRMISLTPIAAVIPSRPQIQVTIRNDS